MGIYPERSKPALWALLCLVALPLVACGGGEAESSEPEESAGGGTTMTQTGETAATQNGQSSCPQARSPSSCGGTPCAAVDPQAALLCTQGCCTEAGTCGTYNALRGTPCVDASGGSGHACPMETVLGASVPGCCVAQSNRCGVLDVTGVIGALAGADANNCVPREGVTLVSLAPLNCDGTAAPSEAGAGSAMAGASGSAMAGASGSTVTGAGGGGPADSCPEGTVCGENSFASGFLFCGSNQGFTGHTPPAASSQEECDAGPGGEFQDLSIIAGCVIPCG